MRRLLTLPLAALLVLAVRAQPPKPNFPPLNVNIAKLVVASPEVGSPLTCVVFHEGKGVLVAGAEDGNLRTWTVAQGKEIIDKDARGQLVKAHERFVTSLAAGGTRLASGSTDGKVHLWNVPPDKPIQTFKAAAAVRALALSADGKLLACGGDDSAVQLYDVTAGKPTLKLTGPTDWVLAVAISLDGKTVAAGGHDGKLWAWEAGTGKKLFEVAAHAPLPPKAPVPEKNVVSALAFSPDGKQLALGGSDSRIYLFGASDGKFVRPLQGHTGTVTALTYHPAGNLLISASKDRSVRLWNPQGGNVLKALEGHTAWVEGIALLSGPTKLISASADQTVRLWDLGAPPPKVTPKKK